MARHPFARRSALIAAAFALAATAGAAPVMPVAAVTPCSITWDGAGTTYTDLDSAVAAAPPGTTILVTGTCPATTDVAKALTIRGTQAGRAARLIGAASAPTISVTNVGLRLENLTVEGRPGDCTVICFGGSLSVFNSDTDLVNVTLIGSRVWSGSGLYIYSGSVRLLGSTIVRAGRATLADTNQGGAIGIGGGTVTIAGRSRVIGSRATAGGAAISVYNAALLIKGRAQVSGNRTTGDAATGGAIVAEGSYVSISGSARITGNRAWGGAGIRLMDGTALDLTGNALVTGNRTDVTPPGTPDLGGAGILADGSGIIIRFEDKARITGNKAGAPGLSGGIRMRVGTTLEVDGTPVTCTSKALRAHVFDNVNGNCVAF